MELSEVRAKIDTIDHQLIKLVSERLDLARDVASAKAQTNKLVFDPARERAKLRDVVEHTPNQYSDQMVSLFSLLMSMNKAEQQKILATNNPKALSKRAHQALKPIDAPFPASATVACQGVEGAYSQQAAEKVFRIPGISFFATFEGVCRAVQDGLCEFGVLPIENSTAGSVNQVYDLLAQYRFSIVRSVRVKIDHNLLAKPGTTLNSITEVYSHEQALAQCANYLEQLGVKRHVCENTAQAATLVAQSDRHDIAALSSKRCAALYGLDLLDEDVQDSDANYTRFVVISATPTIYPGATRTSLMLTLNHEPGSLYRVLERFYALDINMVKLESRPIPGRDFEFVFYFDLDCPIGTHTFNTLLDSLDDVCERYWYFGSYSEVM